MLPFVRFISRDDEFWAYVRMFSERIGYTERGRGRPKQYTIKDLVKATKKEGMPMAIVINEEHDTPTHLAEDVLEYMNARSKVLIDRVKPNLLVREEARAIYEELLNRYDPEMRAPMNKQKGEKRHPAYLTGIVNVLTETVIGSTSFDASPRALTKVVVGGKMVATFSRWMDGAYPGVVNPSAVWEIKEYYGTTTFGSRVADGVYESMLDGMEINNVESKHGLKIHHYLIVDDRFTWWECGISYLCRIIDMLNMGLVDEVLFGKEVVTRWPEIVRSWNSPCEK